MFKKLIRLTHFKFGDNLNTKINIRYFTNVLFFIIFIFSLNTVAKTNPNSIDELKKLIPDSTVIENKVVYVDFWASWCVPCRKSFPWMKELLSKYSDSGLIIITINVDKNLKAAQKFLTKNDINSIPLFDSKGEIAKSFSLQVMPTSFVYNKSGEFVFKHEGFSNKESSELEKKIVTLLHDEDIKDE